MPRKPIKFNLDFMRKDIFSRFTVKQFDDVTFTITPLLNNEPYDISNMTGKIYVGVDNEMYMQDTNITVSNNSIVVKLDKNMLANYGRAYAEIELTDSQGTVTSSSFRFDIDKKIGEGSNIPGAIEGFVEKYKKLTEEFKKKFQTYTTDLDTRFNTLTASQQQDSEVIDARKGETSLRTKIDKIDEQFNTKANLDSVFSMSNMGQDVKEAMTGGSVAVVGKDTILSVNIVNNQVTPPKTSFFEIDKEGNLIDRNNLIKGYYYSNTGDKTTNENAYTTDYIEIDKDLEYIFNFISFVSYWDINKSFISGYIQGSSIPDVPTALELKPQNAKYVRFSIWDENKNECVFCKKENYSKDLKTNYYLKETTIKEDLLDENLKDKINKVNVTNDNYFSTKKITFIGDSITYGVDGSTNGEVVSKPYPTLVSEILGCKCVNEGIPGSTIAGDGVTDSDITHNKIGFFPMCERYTYTTDDSDYIIVFGGINDYIANVKTPLGVKGDNTKMTFYGALKILLDGLIEKYPNSKIGFITPLKKSGWYNNNEYGVNLEKYYNAIVEMCEERSIPILDFFKNGGCYGEIQAWKNINLPDGLHPTQVYYEKLSRPICEFIKSL